MMSVLSLFSGIGGIDLGLERTGGFRTVAFCEIDPFCREVLAHHWPGVPIHDDVRRLTVDSLGGLRPDAIVGGFPCQPHSVAGKRKGQADERHLWPEFARLVRDLRPRWVLAENVPGIRSTAADEVCGDLEAEGYSVWPLVVGADDVGAPHRRKRVWFVAHSNTALREQPGRLGRIGPTRPAEPPGGSAVGQADRYQGGLAVERSGDLLDGERETRRNDADGRGEWPVGSPTGSGLEGQRADAGEPQEPEPRNDGMVHTERSRRETGSVGHEVHAGREPLAGCWPARPGEPQHDWEAPRLAYGASGAVRSAGQPREGSDTWSPQQPLGAPAHGLSERLVRRANREALKAAGNSVVPQVVEAIGYAILAAES